MDGVTAAEYEADLEANLTSVLDRFRSGRPRAPPVRRVHLQPGKAHKTRPLGIPTLEDKILQRAALMIREPVYGQAFLDCAYGFRPGRSAHQALDALWQGLMKRGVAGSLILTSNPSSMRLIGPIFGPFWTNGCVMGKWLNAGGHGIWRGD